MTVSAGQRGDEKHDAFPYGEYRERNLPNAGSDGYDEDYARQALECMGVAVTMQDGEKNGVSAGCVTAQSIEPYAEIGTGDEVTLTVSRGIRGTDGAAPYLVGLSYENALGAAAEAGLTLTVTRKEFSHDCAEPTIKTQAVQASETAADGTVGVELLMPWHSFQMPNLNYKTEGTPPRFWPTWVCMQMCRRRVMSSLRRALCLLKIGPKARHWSREIPWPSQ